MALDNEIEELRQPLQTGEGEPDQGCEVATTFQSTP